MSSSAWEMGYGVPWVAEMGLGRGFGLGEGWGMVGWVTGGLVKGKEEGMGK